jgi:predicted CoA-binding protein
MTTKAEIEEFIAIRELAIAGASRDTKKFGYIVYHDLKSKGYLVVGVNPNATEIDGDPCYATLADLPAPVGGVICLTKPAVTEQIVRQAAAAGIRRVWMQQGAETQAAIDFCKQNGMSVIAHECIMMYQPDTAWFHRAHRFVRDVFGGGPK